MEKRVELLEKENSIFKSQLNLMLTKLAKEIKDIELKISNLENKIMKKNQKVECNNTIDKTIEIMCNNESVLVNTE